MFKDVTYPTYDEKVVGAIAPCPINGCNGSVIWRKKNETKEICPIV
jgi:hypothetical protein